MSPIEEKPRLAGFGPGGRQLAPCRSARLRSRSTGRTKTGSSAPKRVVRAGGTSRGSSRRMTSKAGIDIEPQGSRWTQHLDDAVVAAAGAGLAPDRLGPALDGDGDRHRQRIRVASSWVCRIVTAPSREARRAGSSVTSTSTISRLGAPVRSTHWSTKASQSPPTSSLSAWAISAKPARLKRWSSIEASETGEERLVAEGPPEHVEEHQALAVAHRLGGRRLARPELGEGEVVAGVTRDR